MGLEWEGTGTGMGGKWDFETVPPKSQSGPSQVPLDFHKKFLTICWDYSGSPQGVHRDFGREVGVPRDMCGSVIYSILANMFLFC